MLQLPVIAMRLLAIALVTVATSSAVAFAPGTDAEIRERIKPFGQLRLPEADNGTEEAVAATEREPRAADAIYAQFCGTCHEAGVAGAPRMVADAWEERIEKGMDVLYASTINGLGAMPPGGTCFDCSEEELKKTVDWMVEAVQ